MENIDLSPLSLFLQAGPVEKGVIVALLLASIWCWVLITESLFAVLRLRRAMRLVQSAEISPLLAPLFDAGRKATDVVIPGEAIGETRVRVAETMQRAAQLILKRTESGLPNLAVISSVAPFVGLFGTVWGIMTSFTGIAAASDTSLAVVAPGISESLAATAYGLAAAIPATIGYNRIGSLLSATGVALNHIVEDRAVQLVSRMPSKEREAA